MAATGIFDTKTEAAVKKLQQQMFPDEPSEWDGIVGPKTWDKMLTGLD